MIENVKWSPGKVVDAMAHLRAALHNAGVKDETKVIVVLPEIEWEKVCTRIVEQEITETMSEPPRVGLAWKMAKVNGVYLVGV